MTLTVIEVGIFPDTDFVIQREDCVLSGAGHLPEPWSLAHVEDGAVPWVAVVGYERGRDSSKTRGTSYKLVIAVRDFRS